MISHHAKFSVKPFIKGLQYVMAMAASRLTASQSLIKGFNLHAYPAGTSFCSCASSRATLHVGSLFLRNRQPSNAPPLLLPPLQNTLGVPPRPHAPERPLGTDYAVPKRGLNGAYRVPRAHLPPSPPLPRSGGGSSCPNHCLSYSSAWQVPTAMLSPRQVSFPHPLTATALFFWSCCHIRF